MTKHQGRLLDSLSSAAKIVTTGCLYLCLGACGGSSGGNRAPANSPPTANAGSDQTVDEQSLVQLAGQGSDPDGGSLSFTWAQVSGPVVALSSLSDTAATFESPQVSIGTDETIVLSLTVTDAQGASRSDQVSISVVSTDRVLFRAIPTTGSSFELFSFDSQTNGVQILSGSLVAGGSVSEMAASPDGRFVAYRASQDTTANTELYVSAMDGSSNIKVSGTLAGDGDVGFTEFAWSPDSSQLVFTAQGDSEDVLDVYLVDRDGSNLRRINTNFVGDLEYEDITWSPDGSYVAARAVNRSNSQVVGIATHDPSAASTDGIRVTPVLPAFSDIASYRWSSDGQFIAYRADIESDENYQIYTVRPDGSDHTLVGRGVTLLAPNPGVSQYAWSPVANTIAFAAVRIDDSLRLYTVQADGSNEIAITPDIDGGETLESMAWSPDGLRIAYVADQDTASTFELYSAAPDGSTVLKLSGTLVTTGDVRGKPSWSPLSDWLVYLALQGPGLLELHAASADGASNVKIDGTMGAFIVPGEGIELWSPLGGQLMYIYDQAADGIFDIHVWDTTSQMSTRISQAQVTGDNLPDHGIWSDDGSRIAYVFEPAGAPASLFLASADGLVNQEITDTLLNNRPVSERFFNWSPGVEMRSDEAAFSPP